MSNDQDTLLSDQLLKILATLIVVLDERTPLFKQILRHQEQILASLERIEKTLAARAP